MIVLRRLAHGVWDHAGVRFTEWLGAGPLMGVGYVLYAHPEALSSTRSFASLAEWASPGTWSNVLLLCGLMRLLGSSSTARSRGSSTAP